MNIKLSLESIAVLDAIDRKGSFAAAAKALSKVPSALTYTVQKLEQDLAVKLFERSGHRAAPTPAGRALLHEGRHLLRAAAEIESQVKRIATGWETELRIAVGDLAPLKRVLPLLAEFYALESGTRVRLSSEVFGGCWDALATGRADLAIGAPAEVPAGGGFGAQPLGTVAFVFAVAPGHPLARTPEPLSRGDIVNYRAVVAADSSRDLAPRTAGVLFGQEALTVPDIRAKLEAQRQGLGVGYLPRYL
ncbi:MAG TPA: LysR family transcriptional regulator, partial [Betaproteobacteria bacterium]|nr:LysR family transcriptional regulator [Betaproteobacteria bacterium]